LYGHNCLGYVMKLSFSLPKSATKPVGDAPPLKRPANFGTLDDDIAGDDALPTPYTSKAGNGDLVAQNIQLSKAAKKRMEKEQQVDATVYQYDEIWDNMQDAKARQKEIKELESRERKVRHLRVVPE
jgi:coiled-coil domain-containing protein 55